MSGYIALLIAAAIKRPAQEKPCAWCGNTRRESHPQMPGATRPCSVCRRSEAIDVDREAQGA